MNLCHICYWEAPTAAALRDHLLTAHPGVCRKEEKPEDRPYDWHGSIDVTEHFRDIAR
jgi:hypothetical protein